jgi:hypothetical protein
MLRFRHLFRSAYGVEFDSERLQVVVGKALALKPIYRQQIESFLEFVRRLE